MFFIIKRKVVCDFVKINSPKQISKKNKPLVMKLSKNSVYSKTHITPEHRFEDQDLTRFSGLSIFQELFQPLSIKKSLRACFRHRGNSNIFTDSTIVLLLIVHMLLGYRKLSHIRYYKDDPMVKHVLGLNELPDVSTISRCLSSLDEKSVLNLQRYIANGVLARLSKNALSRVTLDFDGSVISTGRFVEGSAVGFNKKKKGQRSYYPLFCTIAQTGQVLNILHRSGNVHDSNGSKDFILECIDMVQKILPKVTIEVRMDSAFFNEALVDLLDNRKIEYTISVPFERLVQLKDKVEKRRKWIPLDGPEGCCDFFDIDWKPKSWNNTRRFIAIRKASKIQQKGALQLDLFTPYDYRWEYKVVLTSKTATSRHVVSYHNGRGSQEKIFGELKTSNQMDYVPTKTWLGNQTYLLSAITAHNLSRELQMLASLPERATKEKRPALWKFKDLGTLRLEIIQLAGRIIRPKGKMVLSMAANDSAEKEILHYLDEIRGAA